MGKVRLLRFLEATSLLLFFLQALRAIFSVLFGIIYDQVFLGPIDAWFFISLLLLLAAFCAPALAPTRPRRPWPLVCVTLAGLARIGLNEALDFIGTNTPATFGGDFNAEPDSPVVQAVLQAGFDDPFLALGIDPPPPTAPAIDPQIYIDYVFTRGLIPISAVVLPSVASDHRMVVVELEYNLP